MNLTPLQWLGIIILFNGTLIGGANFLTDLFLSAAMVKAVVAVASLGNMFLGGLVTMFSSQGAVVKQVAAMPGVEKIQVNAGANTALAQVATDPEQPKVGAITPEVRTVLKETAKG